MTEARQQLSASETVRRALRLAHRLTDDDYRAIIRAMPAKKDLRAVRRAVAAVEMGLDGAGRGPLSTGTLPPVEYSELSGSLQDPAIMRMANGKGAPTALAFIVSSALFAILAVVFLGMAIAQNMNPAAVAISAALSVIALRAARVKFSTADVLLDAGMYRAWSVLYAAVLHQAIRAGELEEPRDWGRGKARDLRAAWDAAGLGWSIVGAAR